MEPPTTSGEVGGSLGQVMTVESLIARFGYDRNAVGEYLVNNWASIQDSLVSNLSNATQNAINFIARTYGVPQIITFRLLEFTVSRLEVNASKNIISRKFCETVKYAVLKAIPTVALNEKRLYVKIADKLICLLLKIKDEKSQYSLAEAISFIIDKTGVDVHRKLSQHLTKWAGPKDLREKLLSQTEEGKGNKRRKKYGTGFTKRCTVDELFQVMESKIGHRSLTLTQTRSTTTTITFSTEKKALKMLNLQSMFQSRGKGVQKSSQRNRKIYPTDEFAKFGKGKDTSILYGTYSEVDKMLKMVLCGLELQEKSLNEYLPEKLLDTHFKIGLPYRDIIVDDKILQIFGTVAKKHGNRRIISDAALTKMFTILEQTENKYKFCKSFRLKGSVISYRNLNVSTFLQLQEHALSCILIESGKNLEILGQGRMEVIRALATSNSNVPNNMEDASVHGWWKYLSAEERGIAQLGMEVINKTRNINAIIMKILQLRSEDDGNALTQAKIAITELFEREHSTDPLTVDKITDYSFALLTQVYGKNTKEIFTPSLLNYLVLYLRKGKQDANQTLQEKCRDILQAYLTEGGELPLNLLEILTCECVEQSLPCTDPQMKIMLGICCLGLQKSMECRAETKRIIEIFLASIGEKMDPLWDSFIVVAVAHILSNCKQEEDSPDPTMFEFLVKDSLVNLLSSKQFASIDEKSNWIEIGELKDDVNSTSISWCAAYLIKYITDNQVWNENLHTTLAIERLTAHLVRSECIQTRILIAETMYSKIWNVVNDVNPSILIKQAESLDDLGSRASDSYEKLLETALSCLVLYKALDREFVPDNIWKESNILLPFRHFCFDSTSDQEIQEIMNDRNTTILSVALTYAKKSVKLPTEFFSIANTILPTNSSAQSQVLSILLHASKHEQLMPPETIESLGSLFAENVEDAPEDLLHLIRSCVLNGQEVPNYCLKRMMSLLKGETDASKSNILQQILMTAWVQQEVDEELHNSMAVDCSLRDIITAGLQIPNKLSFVIHKLKETNGSLTAQNVKEIINLLKLRGLEITERRKCLKILTMDMRNNSSRRIPEDLLDIIIIELQQINSSPLLSKENECMVKEVFKLLKSLVETNRTITQTGSLCETLSTLLQKLSRNSCVRLLCFVFSVAASLVAMENGRGSNFRIPIEVLCFLLDCVENREDGATESILADQFPLIVKMTLLYEFNEAGLLYSRIVTYVLQILVVSRLDDHGEALLSGLNDVGSKLSEEERKRICSKLFHFLQTGSTQNAKLKNLMIESLEKPLFILYLSEAEKANLIELKDKTEGLEAALSTVDEELEKCSPSCQALEGIISNLQVILNLSCRTETCLRPDVVAKLTKLMSHEGPPNHWKCKNFVTKVFVDLALHLLKDCKHVRKEDVVNLLYQMRKACEAAGSKLQLETVKIDLFELTLLRSSLESLKKGNLAEQRCIKLLNGIRKGEGPFRVSDKSSLESLFQSTFPSTKKATSEMYHDIFGQFLSESSALQCLSDTITKTRELMDSAEPSDGQHTDEFNSTLEANLNAICIGISMTNLKETKTTHKFVFEELFYLVLKVLQRYSYILNNINIYSVIRSMNYINQIEVESERIAALGNFLSIMSNENVMKNTAQSDYTLACLRACGKTEITLQLFLEKNGDGILMNFLSDKTEAVARYTVVLGLQKIVASNSASKGAELAITLLKQIVLRRRNYIMYLSII